MATLRIKFLATSIQMQMHLLVFLPVDRPIRRRIDREAEGAVVAARRGRRLL
jgi:hypothetical protein